MIYFIGAIMNNNIEITDIFVIFAPNGALLNSLIATTFTHKYISLQVNASLSFYCVLQQLVV